MSKTILMSVFDSNIVRNILRTDVLSTLLANDEVGRIVILTHPSKLDQYRKEFISERIVFEAYPEERPSPRELRAWFVTRYIIHTENVRLKIDELLDHGQNSYGKRLGMYLAALLIYYTSLIRPVDRLLRRIIIASYDSERFATLLQKFAPDLVFLPTIFGNNDLRLLKYCTARGIPTVGMIKSWDNLLGKDALLIWPDRLIVQNEVVKGHATSMYHYPEERLFVSGIPQFDAYADPIFVPTREEYFRTVGLDPAKKLVLYSAMGSWISLYEKEIVRMLADIVNAGSELAFPAQLLVRLHPAYPSDDQELRSIRGIHVVRPGMTGFDTPTRHDFEFHSDDTKELAATLKWADVVLNSGSTMAIDAACFNTPIINIAFDGYAGPQPYKRSARRLVDKQHYRPIVQTGGVRVANDRKELVELINGYLTDRSLDKEGRDAIVAQQCYKLDGRSGRRIGEYIVGLIKNGFDRSGTL